MALDISSLQLFVFDNLNATATATVSGASAGASLTLLVAPWTVQAGARLVWSVAATGTADGSGNCTLANVAQPVGFYAWQVVSMATGTTANQISGAVFRPLIDVTASIHSRILDGVVSALLTLNMVGIGSNPQRIFRRWFGSYLEGTDDDTTNNLGVGLPQIQVSPYPKETITGGLTARDDVAYPVLISIFDIVDAPMIGNIPRNLKWRRQISALFRTQRLAGVPEVIWADVQPDLIVSTEGLAQGYLVGAMTVTFTSRENRGLIP